MNEAIENDPGQSVPNMGAAIRAEVRRSRREGTLPDGRSCSCIAFRDYMELCLYHPEFGYYRSGPSRVGREGDFYTSAHIGDIMGEQLAERLAQLAADKFPEGGLVDVVDWGGGTGRLAGHMLSGWNKMGASGDRFNVIVVDGNPEHLRQARAALSEHIATGRARIMDASEAEAGSWTDRPVMVVANELLDAFPVHRVAVRNGRLQEWAVGWDESNGIPVPCLTEPEDSRFEDWLRRQNVKLEEGQTTEIGWEGAAWTGKLAAMLGEAVLVLIDYGDVTGELTGSHRMDGTLLCYENHRASSDPYRNPGHQDITAHVDFELVRFHALRAGWRELWYGTQKRFLVESGVMSKLVGHGIADPFHPVVRRNRAIRQLLLSDGMSELFKVQIWTKDK